MLRRISCIGIVLLLLAVLGLYIKYPATLRNVYEDSWWIKGTQEWHIHTEWPQWNNRHETLCRMEQMADKREWKPLRDLARTTMNNYMRSDDDKQRALAAIAMRYALLAESCLGNLPYAITSYPVHTPEDFVMFRERTRDACLFNAFFFRELGLPDEQFHHAMEYPLSFAPCTHRALRLMTEAAAQSGDTAVYEKLSVIGGMNELSIAPSTKKSRSNIFVFGDPMLTMFARMLDEDKSNRRMADYTALSFVLINQKEKAQTVLRICHTYDGQVLPLIYK